jgi:hypothetical protein
MGRHPMTRETRFTAANALLLGRSQPGGQRAKDDRSARARVCRWSYGFRSDARLGVNKMRFSPEFLTPEQGN